MLNSCIKCDYEAAVAYLLPKDPVVKRKHQEGKRTSGEISDTKAEVADFGSKPGIGKTGVHLRYHNKVDYKNLNKEQQDELREWRKKNPQPGGGGKSDAAKKRQKTEKKAMAAAIKKGVEKELSARAAEAEKKEEGGLLMELLVNAVGRKSGSAKAASTSASPTKEAILNAILKKAQASAASAGPP